MNRAIKFRVFNKKTNKWVHPPNQEVNLFGEMILCGGFMQKVPLEELDDCVALQFTGLLDIDGEEIYEGDIVKIEDGVAYSIDKGGKSGIFEIEAANGSYWAGGFNCLSHIRLQGRTIKVIGNIFDNPELLSA